MCIFKKLLEIQETVQFTYGNTSSNKFLVIADGYFIHTSVPPCRMQGILALFVPKLRTGIDPVASLQ